VVYAQASIHALRVRTDALAGYFSTMLWSEREDNENRRDEIEGYEGEGQACFPLQLLNNGLASTDNGGASMS